MQLTADGAVDRFLRLLYTETKYLTVRLQFLAAMKVDKRQFEVAFDIQRFGFLVKGLQHIP